MGFSFSFGIADGRVRDGALPDPALTALIGHAAWWPGHGDRTVEPAEEHEPVVAGSRES